MASREACIVSGCSVIWCDKRGEWHAFHDACPHRLVPLSDGRITPSGELECPYHGWRFEGGGRCTTMPQGGDPSAPRSCATAYQCIVKQGGCRGAGTLAWSRIGTIGGMDVAGCAAQRGLPTAKR